MEKLVSEACQAAEGVEAQEGALTPEALAAMAQWAEALQKDPELMQKYQELQKLAQELDHSKSQAKEGGKLGPGDQEKVEKLMKGLRSLAGSGAGETQDPAALQQMLSQMMGGSGTSPGERESIKLPGNQQLGPDGVKKDEEGIMMKPEPGFVLKTTENNTKTKVFINICQSDLISEPALKKKLDDDGNEIEGLNVPVSVGQVRSVKDNAGKDCFVYDCVMNPKVLSDSREDKTGGYRDFLCQLSIEYVESKYKCSLDRRYKLPKIKYKGGIAVQRVRDIKKIPKIEEVSSAKTPSSTSKKKKCTVKKKVEEVDLKHLAIECCSVDNNGEECLLDISDISEPSINKASFPDKMLFRVFGVKCPDAEKMKIDLSAFSMMLEIPGFHRKDIVLPFPAKEDCTVATLIPTNQELKILVEVDDSDFDKGPDPGSRLWMLQNALHEEGDTQQGQGKGDMQVKKEISWPAVNMETPWHEDDVLPEDTFHKKDMISQHNINLQETGRKEKHEKFEKERQERKDDENTEYIDPDDYREGGKYGPPDKSKIVIDDGSTNLLSEDQQKILLQASGVLSKIKEQKKKKTNSQESLGQKLKSNLWSELLD